MLSSSLTPLCRELVGGFVEEVVGRVRHERLLTDVCWRGTARRRCGPSRGVQPLDEGGLRQRVAAGWSVLGSDHLQQEQGNVTPRDEAGIGVGFDRLGPDS